MASVRRLILCAWIAVFAAWPAFASTTVAPQEEAKAPAQEDRRSSLREAILLSAQRYSDFRWRGDEKNALHGEDPNGTHIDTPDESFDPAGWRVDGSENVGMPYAWGGFSSIEEFERGLRLGHYAGHVPSTEHMDGSAYSLGLDCSGFVSRCWDLPLKQSTRSLGSLCTELASYDELQPGDIINKFDSHVVLFKEFLDPQRSRMRVVEAARLKVAESDYEVAQLKSAGFVPMRYAPLQVDWVPMDALKATTEVSAKEKGGEFERSAGIPRSGESAREEFLGLAPMLAGAGVGDWVRYHFVDSGREPKRRTITHLLARRGGEWLHTQTHVDTEIGALMRTGRASVGLGSIEELLLLTCPGEPYREVKLESARIEEGEVVLAGKRHDALRVHLTVEAQLLMRHAHYPTTMEFGLVVSDEVPVCGITEVRLTIETDYAQPGTSAARLYKTERNWSLLAFGKGD